MCELQEDEASQVSKEEKGRSKRKSMLFSNGLNGFIGCYPYYVTDSNNPLLTFLTLWLGF